MKKEYKITVPAYWPDDTPVEIWVVEYDCNFIFTDNGKLYEYLQKTGLNYESQAVREILSLEVFKGLEVLEAGNAYFLRLLLKIENDKDFVSQFAKLESFICGMLNLVRMRDAVLKNALSGR